MLSAKLSGSRRALRATLPLYRRFETEARAGLKSRNFFWAGIAAFRWSFSAESSGGTIQPAIHASAAPDVSELLSSGRCTLPAMSTT